jgi:hypothetical protein
MQIKECAPITVQPHANLHHAAKLRLADDVNGPN